jgi:hypothetical protein
VEDAENEETEDGVRGVVDETAEGVADEDNEAEDDASRIGEGAEDETVDE